MFVTYTLRNIWARKLAIIPTLLAVVITVGATTFMLGLLDGLTHVIMESGATDHAVVVSPSAKSELTSNLKVEVLPRVKVAPGVKNIDGLTAVSPELVLTLRARTVENKLRLVQIRAVDPIAYKLHGDIQIVSGSMPKPNTPGLLVGVGQTDHLKGIVEGKGLRVGRHVWPIVGTFRAPGTMFESEIWVDRGAIGAELRREDFSVVYAALENEGALSAFGDVVTRIRDPKVEVMSERKLMSIKLEQLQVYVRAIVAVTFILALASIFACTNTTYTALLTRLRELATLLAMGFTRRRVASIILFESVAVAVLGGALGVAMVLPLHGHVFHQESMAMAYSLRVSPSVLTMSATVTGLIGFISGIGSVIQIMRLGILEALRA